jgi:hypothetical protein
LKDSVETSLQAAGEISLFTFSASSLNYCVFFSPASQNAPTSSEQLQIDSEMDGTAEGEEKAEQKRQKDEKWAQFTDANQRGTGNTMNRG